MFVRDGKFYVRRRIPQDVDTVVGRAEIWRSLRTDSLETALRRFPPVASNIEAFIAQARHDAGISVDAMLLEARVDHVELAGPKTDLTTAAGPQPEPSGNQIASLPCQPASGTTFAEAYDRYVNDPTQSWSERTRETYETCRKVAVSVIGENLPIADVSRTHIRDFLDVLRFLPKNAAKRFPKLSPREAADRMRLESAPSLISSANANAYLTSLSTFINWSVNEELFDVHP